jgi:phosphoribosylamine--glycine ligase
MTPRRILVVGSGGREHALCWRLATEAGVERVIVAPGNPLMDDVADVRSDVSLADQAGLLALVQQLEVELVVVGPEAPLVAGLADALTAAGIACFGPSAAAAALEGSKAFCRQVSEAAGVAMADGRAFDDVAPAVGFARSLGAPLVVKADGLAAGKGVVIAATLDEAEAHIRAAIENRRFGQAGRRVVVERFLEGAEASVIALCDGELAVALPAARDHKRLADGDTGPNTGGMGAYSPLPDLDEAAAEEILATVHRPVLAELALRGTPFRGALYAGLMLTADGPRLLEFNVRLGDPEAQAILPRLASPLAPLLTAAAGGKLSGAGPWLPEEANASVAVTLATAGYPVSPRAGDPISGIEAARAAGALVFGAGVRRDEQGSLVTSGGRVLTVVGTGREIEDAARMAYGATDLISFAGRQIRNDIGRRVQAPVGALA